MQEGGSMDNKLPIVFKTTDIMSTKHAADIYVKLKNIEAMCEVVKDAIKQYVDQHGCIPLEDGKVYKRCDETNRFISIDSVTDQILSDHLGDRALDAVDKKISFTSLSKVVREIHGKGKEGAAAEKKLIADLDANGCIKQYQKQVYKVTKEENK